MVTAAVVVKQSTILGEEIMARRYTGKMNGERYLGNTKSTEVHDLDNETNQCQIDEIIQASHETPFETLTAAENAGYDRCHWCLGNSKR